MLSAALGLSEAFQHVRGYAVAGRRSAGISLWNPKADWRSQPGYGKPCSYLPSRLWLVGLGHLGQAYAWTLGLLPYVDTSKVTLMLQDYDNVVAANISTGMLSTGPSVSRPKTRVVSARMETLGFKTVMTERCFDNSTVRGVDEPGVALVGVDSVAPRRLLEKAGFDLVIDAGLGAGHKTTSTCWCIHSRRELMHKMRGNSSSHLQEETLSRCPHIRTIGSG